MSNKVEIVAEISGNHNGSLNRAKELISAAKESGADRAKIQTYTPDTITINSNRPQFMVDQAHKLWGGRSLYSLYQEAHTPWEWHEELFSHAKSEGISLFSTPFDPTAVKFLETFGVELYKIASLETGDTPLLRAIADTGKPIYASTGASSWEDLDYMYGELKRRSKADVTMLLCVSAYPAQLSDMNLQRFSRLKGHFDGLVGISDHCIENDAAIASVHYGARVIEKHLTISRADDGPDNKFSLEPHELKSLVDDVKNAVDIRGTDSWESQESETQARRFRKSLYLIKDVIRGEILSEHNVKSIRPGGGLEPKLLDSVLGSVFKNDYLRGEPLTMDMLD
jgi:pseudaminic acid synthase